MAVARDDEIEGEHRALPRGDRAGGHGRRRDGRREQAVHHETAAAQGPVAGQLGAPVELHIHGAGHRRGHVVPVGGVAGRNTRGHEEVPGGGGRHRPGEAAEVRGAADQAGGSEYAGLVGLGVGPVLVGVVPQQELGDHVVQDGLVGGVGRGNRAGHPQARQGPGLVEGIGRGQVQEQGLAAVGMDAAPGNRGRREPEAVRPADDLGEGIDQRGVQGAVGVAVGRHAAGRDRQLHAAQSLRHGRGVHGDHHAGAADRHRPGQPRQDPAVAGPHQVAEGLVEDGGKGAVTVVQPGPDRADLVDGTGGAEVDHRQLVQRVRRVTVGGQDHRQRQVVGAAGGQHARVHGLHLGLGRHEGVDGVNGRGGQRPGRVCRNLPRINEIVRSVERQPEVVAVVGDGRRAAGGDQPHRVAGCQGQAQVVEGGGPPGEGIVALGEQGPAVGVEPPEEQACPGRVEFLLAARAFGGVVQGHAVQRVRRHRPVHKFQGQRVHGLAQREQRRVGQRGRGGQHVPLAGHDHRDFQVHRVVGGRRVDLIQGGHARVMQQHRPAGPFVDAHGQRQFPRLAHVQVAHRPQPGLHVESGRGRDREQGETRAERVADGHAGRVVRSLVGDLEQVGQGVALVRGCVVDRQVQGQIDAFDGDLVHGQVVAGLGILLLAGEHAGGVAQHLSGRVLEHARAHEEHARRLGFDLAHVPQPHALERLGEGLGGRRVGDVDEAGGDGVGDGHAVGGVGPEIGDREGEVDVVPLVGRDQVDEGGQTQTGAQDVQGRGGGVVVLDAVGLVDAQDAGEARQVGAAGSRLRLGRQDQFRTPGRRQRGQRPDAAEGIIGAVRGVPVVQDHPQRQRVAQGDAGGVAGTQVGQDGRPDHLFAHVG